MNVPFDLTCWYLNERRIIELVGADRLATDLSRIARSAGSDEYLRKNLRYSALKRGVTDWLIAHNPPTLGQLILRDELREGQLFTNYSNTFFKGLGAVHSALNKGRPAPMAEGYIKIDEWKSGARLNFRFSHEHLTSTSAWVELSGQSRMLLLGLVTSASDDAVGAIPYVIANPVPHLGEGGPFGSFWANRLEVHVAAIDSFSRIRERTERPQKAWLDALRNVPESEVKKAFAEIIGEPSVSKDWGGERSDLFTSRLEVDGKPVSAAFLFKGPAKFHPMTMADLGKNGDQIERMFTEPADLLILQHCHEVTVPVRSMMRAFAQQVGNVRLFCVIDGYDTYRILKTYGKGRLC